LIATNLTFVWRSNVFMLIQVQRVFFSLSCSNRSVFRLVGIFYNHILQGCVNLLVSFLFHVLLPCSCSESHFGCRGVVGSSLQWHANLLQFTITWPTLNR
jgi:hypothetical protein